MAADIAAYWNDYAEAYDREPDHGMGDPATRRAWASLLGQWLPSAPARVADLACGTGALTVLAAELGHEVVGVDLADRMLERARAKTAGFGDRVRIVRGDVADPPVAPHGVDVVTARHIVWTLPDPWSALRRWVELVRPGGRLLLIEGRWASAGDDAYAEGLTLPWAPGVTATELQAAVAPLVARTTVVPLTDPALWGRTVSDERYLLVADR